MKDCSSERRKICGIELQFIYVGQRSDGTFEETYPMCPFMVKVGKILKCKKGGIK